MKEQAKTFEESDLQSDSDNRECYSKINLDRQFYGFKLILIGDIKVGKTTLFNLFNKNKSRNNSNSILSPECIKIPMSFKDLNSVADIHIWDTQGEEKYNTITQQY